MSKYKSNYLLKGAAIFSCIFLVFCYVFGIESIFENSSRANVNYSFVVFCFSVVIVAPIMEEFTFRGSFTESSKLKIVSIISIPILILYLGKLELIIPVVLYVILLILDIRLNLNKPFIYFFNATLFAFFHYQLIDFYNLKSIVPMFMHLGLGLLLIWVVINKTIVKSIIIHAFYNFILVLISFIYLQYPDSRVKSIEEEKISIEWKKVPILNSRNSAYQIHGDKKIEGKAISPIKILHLLGLNGEINKYTNAEPFFVVDIDIKAIDSESKLNGEKVKHVLLKANLIRELND